MVIPSPRHLAEIPATAATRIQEVPMSRMFHRVFVASAISAAALAAPATALAADSGARPGGGAAQTPTSVVLHLPQHVQPGQPITVTARVSAVDAAQNPGATPQPGKDGSHGKGPGKGQGRQGGGKGHGTTKSGGHRKGTGHGKGRRHPVTGEVVFFLDGRAEAPAEIDRGLASEKIDIPLGRHTLVAEYTGDSDHESARSAPVTFDLTPGQPDDGQGQQFQGPAGQDNGDDGQDQGGYGYGQNGSGDGQDQYGQGQDTGDQSGPGQDAGGQYGPGQDFGPLSGSFGSTAV
jgi:hypothetical protein